ncbi:unnamed protein product [Nesidiocoris tenuis]|uniref:Uncharacterized protein n=1 Tax=Nesidiocoris tenuis TaxID=355587 RepID=A0A6H5GTS6_9HEMI|nr:unnamed protein product [Nesidiocoris tenuis]
MARRDEEMMNYPGARPIGMSYVMSAELTGLHLDDYLKRNLALRLPGLEDFGMRKTRKGRCTNSDQTCVPGSASSEDVVHIELMQASTNLALNEWKTIPQNNFTVLRLEGVPYVVTLIPISQKDQQDLRSILSQIPSDSHPSLVRGILRTAPTTLTLLALFLHSERWIDAIKKGTEVLQFLEEKSTIISTGELGCLPT